MEVYLIRHTTPLIEQGLIYGRLDVALSTDFQAEKEEVLWQLPESFDAVYSSPSCRCSRLAACIKVKETGFYKESNCLYELNFGDWEGKTWETINRAESEIWMNDFVHLAPPGGETMLEMERRVMLFWGDLLKSSLERVAVVTHGGVIRIILAHYRAVPLKDAFTIKVGLAEVVKLCV